MIEINLLPSAGKKKANRGRAANFGALASGMSGKLRDKFLIAAIVCVVIGGGALAYLYSTLAKQEGTLAEHQATASADSTRYALFLKDRYRSESIRDSLLRQVNIIQSLDEDRYVWPHVLDEISRALPQFTWLTTLGFSGTAQGAYNVVIGPKPVEDTSAVAKRRSRPPKRMDTAIPKDVISIRLQGRTVDLQAVTRFMKDLEASPFFSNIQLDKSESVTDQGKEVAQFQLTIGYTRPDTLLLRRTSLSLVVR